MTAQNDKIRELAITMHEKRSIMQALHLSFQRSKDSMWTSSHEADYQVSRAEYYAAKNALEAAVNGSAS